MAARLAPGVDSIKRHTGQSGDFAYVAATQMPVRIFLYAIAAIVVLLLGAGIVWTLFGDELLEYALVPDAPVEILDAVEENAYADPALWLIRPDKAESAADWLPEGYPPETTETGEEAPRDAAPAPLAYGGEKLPVFYVLPTTYYKRDRWNAGFDDPEARPRQEIFAASQASAFTHVGEIWAPLYRQAVIGAFLTDHRNAETALRFAYRDVKAAFEYFLSQIGDDQPFILVGHSQGGLHLTTLLHEEIAGTPLAGRIAAAYIVGWPISVETDLPEIGLPACQTPEQAQCIVAFQSFAEPADPGQVLRIYDATTGYTGAPRRDTDMLCVNPLTGTTGGEAPESANLGSLVPHEDDDSADLVVGRIPARCGERGFLLIGDPPEGYERYVMPGNNYHVFDFLLFWANLRADAARRVSAFMEGRG